MKKHLALAKHHTKNILTSSITGPNKRANKKLRAEHYLENMNHFMVSLLLAGMIGMYSFVQTRSFILTAEAANISHSIEAKVYTDVPHITSDDSNTEKLDQLSTEVSIDEWGLSSAPEKRIPIQ